MNAERPKASENLVLDRRVNIVSLANLAALIGLLFAAFGTWYGVVGKVDILTVRMDSIVQSVKDVQSDRKEASSTRDAAIQSLRDRTEIISTRTSVIETKVNGVVDAVRRIESKIETKKEEKK